MNIPLQGDCTIETAQTLHDQLKQALNKGQPITLSFAGLGYADMSFFQIIQAAIHSFEKRRIALTLQADLPHHLSHKAILCGLPQIVPSTQAR